MLVLNQSYEPISICSARKAMLLLFLSKAELVSARKNRFIRSVNSQFPHPSVIRLSNYYNTLFNKIELSRKNILRRDDHKCQYCGKKNVEMTVDHIIPKSKGGADSWDNLVTACVKCNNIKGNRAPEEVGMKLHSKPRKPNHITFLKQAMGTMEDDWRPFLFMD